jgi:hypothetical protein
MIRVGVWLLGALAGSSLFWLAVWLFIAFVYISYSVLEVEGEGDYSVTAGFGVFAGIAALGSMAVLAQAVASAISLSRRRQVSHAWWIAGACVGAIAWVPVAYLLPE